MAEQLLELFDFSQNNQTPMSLVMITMIMAGVLGSLIGFVYRKNHYVVSVEQRFELSLVAICIVVAVIMLVISTNVLLSLGLIGALSIIRFRAAIKNILDMVYIFWAVGTGLTIGAGAYPAAVSLTFGLGIIFYFAERSGYLRFGADSVIVSLNGSSDALNNGIIIEMAAELQHIEMKSMQASSSSGNAEFVYSVNSKSPEKFDRWLENIRALDQNLTVSVLKPETNLYL